MYKISGKKKAVAFLATLLALSNQGMAVEKIDYARDIKPLVDKYCVSCHGPDKMKSSFRMDVLGNDFTGKKLFKWEHVFDTLEFEEMPPSKAKKQPTAKERALLIKWVTSSIDAARLKDREMNGSVRRLTKSQYRNTLQQLLALDVNLAKVLPPDAVSHDGFRNNGSDMQLSPLQMEYYFSIAEKALELSIVDENTKPAIQNFRMDLGQNVNKNPYKGRLILGAGGKLLNQSHFKVNEFEPKKPFDLTSFRMRKEYQFIEGYAGNSTVRGMRQYNDLAHSVFADFRGANGYAKGQQPYSLIDNGLLLRPSRPTSEKFGEVSTFGPSPNFKIALRELPDGGNFRVKVKASRYRDTLTLEENADTFAATGQESVAVLRPELMAKTIKVDQPGIYQLDLGYQPGMAPEGLNVTIGAQQINCNLKGGSAKLGRKIEVAKKLKKIWFDSIKVTLPGKQRMINLNELELFSGGKNIANKAKLTASSIYEDNEVAFGWDHLVDGNTDARNLAHSKEEDNPWFKLQFEGDIQAEKLIIWNRPKFEQRLEGARIEFFKKGKRVHLHNLGKEVPLQTVAVKLLRLEAGEHKLNLSKLKSSKLKQVTLSRLNETSPQAKRFAAYEKKSPYLGVHLGFRRDDGSTLAPVGEPQLVTSSKAQTYVFQGAINDFPNPVLPAGNLNYLAGVREIGVRSEYVDATDMPRLNVHSVEFEGPYYDSWPTKSHKSIFIDSKNKTNKAVYAREIIANFIAKAYRRPTTETELAIPYKIWQQSFEEHADFNQSIKDALLVVLTSPQFLFIIENSKSGEMEALNEYELASKLSYFLHDCAPDKRLLKLAKEKKIAKSLDWQLDVLMSDKRFDKSVEAFTYQWLQLDKFDSVEVDGKMYKTLDKHARAQLKREPLEFMKHLIRNNMPLKNLLNSDFIVANDAIAEYYGLKRKPGTGLAFAPLKHGDVNRGGILSQTAILAGLSDGRESNPVKRGAWLARKIVAEPPAEPPPNVPGIDENSNKNLTLRQKLEKHRNQDGCRKCHEKIDPWGIPFESLDAGGFLKKKSTYDASSELPDGTDVKDLNGLKTYLEVDRIDQVAFSFMKHLATYAVGRSLSYSEIVYIKEQGETLKDKGYRMQDMIRFIVKSDIFLKK